MEVFTAEWIANLKKELVNWPSHKPMPPHYNLATEPQFGQLRDQIEEWVAIFPTTTRKLLISRLRSRNVSDVINEMRIGVQLKRAGYEVEYEPALLGVTPDWLVTDQNSKYIVEVFTSSFSGVEDTVWNTIWDLRGRLEQIPIPYALSIDISPTPAILNQATNQRLAQLVRTWLTTRQPMIGDSREWLGAAITVVHHNPAYSKLQVIGPGHA